MSNDLEDFKERWRWLGWQFLTRVAPIMIITGGLLMVKDGGPIFAVGFLLVAGLGLWLHGIGKLWAALYWLVMALLALGAVVGVFRVGALFQNFGIQQLVPSVVGASFISLLVSLYSKRAKYERVGFLAAAVLLNLGLHQVAEYYEARHREFEAEAKAAAESVPANPAKIIVQGPDKREFEFPIGTPVEDITQAMRKEYPNKDWEPGSLDKLRNDVLAGSKPLPKFRKLYPEYNDLSDEDLARVLYVKFYKDMAWEDFLIKVGLPVTTAKPRLFDDLIPRKNGGFAPNP